MNARERRLAARADQHFPSASSSLDPIQTTRQSARAPIALPPPPDRVDPAGWSPNRSEAYARFLHSGWAPLRARVDAAIEAQPGAGARVERFRRCGMYAAVEKAADQNDLYRLTSFRCGDRFCLPCAQRKARLLADRLAQKLNNRSIRFVTLTIRSTPAPLKACTTRLMRAWNKFTRSSVWRDTQEGAVAFLEVTRNKLTGWWHPHLHVIACGRFVAQQLLRRAWSEAVGEDSIVDIRAVKHAKAIISYVVGYAAKPFDAAVFDSPAHASELVGAFHRRRTIFTTGDLRGTLPDPPRPVEHVWTHFAPLWDVLARAARHEPLASRILDQLFPFDRSPCDFLAPESPP